MTLRVRLKYIFSNQSQTVDSFIAFFVRLCVVNDFSTQIKCVLDLPARIIEMYLNLLNIQQAK